MAKPDVPAGGQRTPHVSATLHLAGEVQQSLRIRSFIHWTHLNEHLFCAKPRWPSGVSQPLPPRNCQSAGRERGQVGWRRWGGKLHGPGLRPEQCPLWVLRCQSCSQGQWCLSCAYQDDKDQVERRGAGLCGKRLSQTHR